MRKKSTNRSQGGSEGFIEVLLDAGEMITHLEVKLNITTRTGGQIKLF